MNLPIMIDSGAFSAWTRNKPVDLQSYIAYLHRLKQRYPSQNMVFVNLDVIGDGEQSYNNWREMRRQGLDVIPVFHGNTDVKWLKLYLTHADHLAIGAVAKMHTVHRIERLDRVWSLYLTDDKGRPTVKVHGMGIGSFGILERYPWHSIDSTNWLKKGSYGHIWVPPFHGGQWCYNKAPLTVFVSDEAPKNTGDHFVTLSPQQQDMVMRYVRSVGFVWGRTKLHAKGPRSKPVIIQKGVSNFHGERKKINLLYVAQRCQLLPWPRRFKHKQKKGLVY